MTISASVDMLPPPFPDFWQVTENSWRRQPAASGRNGFDFALCADIICIRMSFVRRNGNPHVSRYARPATVDEALALLAEGPWRVLAGGTDFYPALGAKPLLEDVLDVGKLDGLRGISETFDHIVVGARTTWTDILRTPLPPAFDALKQAAREVGSVQIQNRATVAGNLCNASPAADGVPALMVLDAAVELSSTRATRTLPLGDFILGNRKTARAQAELVTAIRIPKTSTSGVSSFYKLGARRYLVISIAMAAARIVVEDGRVQGATVAVGACSAVAQRLGAVEAALTGRAADGALADIVQADMLAGLSPIDDVRGSAGYRRDAALEIVRRAIAGALGASAPTVERAA
jgi:CO/xanthine dehydrogenase FAD-binding subunit